jgi:hypothetical protein
MDPLGGAMLARTAVALGFLLGAASVRLVAGCGSQPEYPGGGRMLEPPGGEGGFGLSPVDATTETATSPPGDAAVEVGE